MDSVRNSSMGGKARKEVRPITDSNFKSQCVDKILDFLVSGGYEHQLQRRTLLTPSTKDFANIFNVSGLELETKFMFENLIAIYSVTGNDIVLNLAMDDNLDIIKITLKRDLLYLSIYLYILFQFIYRHLDGQYNMPNRFEEEIPRLLKLWKYPVQMSKSSFITG